jgi:hypothetical protein
VRAVCAEAVHHVIEGQALLAMVADHTAMVEARDSLGIVRLPNARMSFQANESVSWLSMQALHERGSGGDPCIKYAAPPSGR